MKRLIVLTALLMTCNWLQAQNSKTERKGRIEAQRSAYITARIGLSQESSQSFWPVYNKYRTELESNRESSPKLGGKRQLIDDKTDIELKEFMDRRFKMVEEQLRIQKRYHQEFLKILSVRQLAKFYQAEEEFKKEIIKEIKRR